MFYGNKSFFFIAKDRRKAVIQLSPVASTKLGDLFSNFRDQTTQDPLRNVRIPFVIDKPVPVASPTGIDSGDKPQITVEKHLISGAE